MSEREIEISQQQHEAVLRQMKIDTFINAIVATATIMTFFTFLVHHTNTLHK